MMKYRLSELFDLQMGKTPARNNKDYWNSPDYAWISIADLSNCDKYICNTKECISVKAVAESGIKLIPDNTVIMSFKLSIGKVAITPKEMYSNEAIMAFIDKKVIDIDPTYLYYLLQAQTWEDGTNKAVLGKTLNKATLSDYKIDFHVKERQQEIVHVLDKVSSLISLRKQQLEKLDELVKARFVEMFGDPVENPMGWEKTLLCSIAEVGSSKRIFEKEYVSKGVPFYRTKEIVELSKGNPITTELFISRDRFSEIKESFGAPQKGDLLISAVGTIGVIWIVDGRSDFYFKDGNLLRVQASDKFVSVFMKHQLERLIEEYKKQLSSGTAYAALTISALSKMNVSVVPMEQQIEYESFVLQTDKAKSSLQRSLDKLGTLKNALMQEYFG